MSKRFNIAAIIQARMGSTRFPGKVLMDIGGQTMLARVIHRVQRAKMLDRVIIATTTETRDDVIIEEADRLGVSVYRGSESDVLYRYYQAALEYKVEVVVRITSDCPLIDPELTDDIIRRFIEAHPPYDYASNGLERTYPRGLDVEVMWFKVLFCAWREAKEPYQRVHVTPFIKEHPERFRLLSVTGGQGKELRWTVDTPEDLTFMRAVYEKFNNSDTMQWREVLDLIEREPEIAAINRHIQQKGPKEI